MINVAQIGVGYWGPNLLRNFVSNNRAVLSRVADLSEERRRYVHKLYPAVHVGSSVEEIMQDRAVQAVVIATPVATHFELAMWALKSGKHVLVEKPLATSFEQVERLGEAARAKGLTVMAGHTFLFNAAVRYVKGLIDSGELGEIRYIYSQRLNLGRIRSDVDALWNLAPHDVSIIQYWLDDPVPLTVSRRGVDYIQEGVDDVVFLNLVYPNKIMANIHVSWLDPHRVRSMVVVGSRKMVVYDDAAENKVRLYDKGIDRRAVLGQNMDFDKPSFPIFDHRSGDVLMPKIDFKEPISIEVEHFLNCIENGATCITGVEHAGRVVRILEMASAG
jgi:predicted dehydrogenase